MIQNQCTREQLANNVTVFADNIADVEELYKMFNNEMDLIGLKINVEEPNTCA